MKEEALSYKEKLEEATNELKGFKNFNQMGVDEAIEKIAIELPRECNSGRS